MRPVFNVPELDRPRRRSLAAERRPGFTLLEVLVATAVLAILGTFMLTLLRGGIQTWRRGEARRQTLEKAQLALGLIEEDLTTLFTENPDIPADYDFSVGSLFDDYSEGSSDLGVTHSRTNVRRYYNDVLCSFGQVDEAADGVVEYTFRLPFRIADPGEPLGDPDHQETAYFQVRMDVYRTTDSAQDPPVIVDAGKIQLEVKADDEDFVPACGATPCEYPPGGHSGNHQPVYQKYDISDYVKNAGVVTIRMTLISENGFGRARLLYGRKGSGPVFHFHAVRGDYLEPIRLLADYDDRGQQRVRFIRTLRGELENPVTRAAGEATGSPDFYDLLNDDTDSLRALGGVAEIAYVMLGDSLYRGVRAPIMAPYGYPPGDPDEQPVNTGSFFYVHPGPDDEYGTGDEIPDENIDEPGEIKSKCLPIATKLLYFGVKFWDKDTTTWRTNPSSPHVGAAVDAEDRPAWDSFVTDSQGYIIGDKFPEKIQVTLVIKPVHVSQKIPRLKMDIDDAFTGPLHVESTDGFPDPGGQTYIKVADEWLRYRAKDLTHFDIDGRGVRGTEAAAHNTGDDVLRGETFVTSIDIPCFRKDVR